MISEGSKRWVKRIVLLCAVIYGYCAGAAAFLVFALVCDGECPELTVSDVGLLLLISIFWPWSLLKSPHPWADASAGA